MIAEKMKNMVANSSAIRAMFEEGNRLDVYKRQMESLFMEATISLVTMLGAETPTKMSAPSKASLRVPFLPSRLVTSTIFSLSLIHIYWTHGSGQDRQVSS